LFFQFWNSEKATSLVAKKDVPLATQIEEAIKKNESLEALSVNAVRKTVPSSPFTRKITIRYKEETQRSRKLIPLSKRANMLLELGPWPKKKIKECRV
jgi:hypothetical protein